jgi:hypothetical protein
VSPVNLNHLALIALCFAGLLMWGGTALTRRQRWPLFIPAVLFLGLAICAFLTVWLLASVYFQVNNDQAIPWIENLGIALGLLVAASVIASIYFFCAACIVSLYHLFHPESKPNDA